MEVKLNTEVGAADLAQFDSVVVATGVTPRKVKLPIASSFCFLSVLLIAVTSQVIVCHASLYSTMIC